VLVTDLTIIDSHVHLGAWRHPGFPGVSCDIETVVKELTAQGVSGVALTTSDEADNGALLQASLSCPLTHWIFLWVRPGDDSLAELVRQYPDTVRGLKIHPSIEQIPLGDPRWDPCLELAREHGLRVMVHTGRWQEAAGHGLAMDMAARFPEVQFILSHAGGDTPPLCMGAADQVVERGLENVAFDTSGLREHWALSRAMHKAGHHRYMLGSDFPLAHPAMYIAQFMALPVPDAWKPDLLGGNALRLLGQPSVSPAAFDRPVPAPTRAAPPVVGDDPTTVLVTGAGGPIGVNLTRSLRLCKRPLVLIGSDANPLHKPLAITDKIVSLPVATSTEYLAQLNDLIEQEGIEAVMPTHPVEVRALAGVRDQVKAKLFLPPTEVIDNGQDKWRSYELFRDGGVPVPKSIRIDGPEDVARAFDELGDPPIWFRGAGVPGRGIGVASLPCTEPGVAQAWVEHHKGYGLMMASEYLPGDNLTWLCVWYEGKLWGSQTRERLEYVIPHVSPSGVTGAPAVARTVRRPEVQAAGEAAVRAVNPGPPHGIFFVDLKSDRDGVPRVTEINSGRFGTTMHFYSAAGYNFPELALTLCLGETPDRVVQDPIPEHTYWIRTLDCGPVLLPGDAVPTD